MILRLSTLVIIILLFCAWMISNKSTVDQVKEEKLILLLRKIGHEVLLQSTDSTSRVLPIKKIDEQNYQISFENDLHFKTDSLVKLVKDNLEDTLPYQQILVSVKECHNQNIIYVFEIDPRNSDIVPCLEREQEKGCYVISISLQERVAILSQFKGVFQLSSLFLLLMGLFFGFLIFKKTQKTALPIQEEHVLTFGRFSFDYETQQLKKGNQIIKLTHKETKLFNLLASSPNEILERDFLLKKVWEDEGVFVGRSLDVFISKLRKKIQGDAAVRIVNIHGKGYKLEVNS